MDLTCTRPGCNTPDNAIYCQPHAQALAEALIAAAVTVDAVQDTVAGRDRMPERGGRIQVSATDLVEPQTSTGKPLQPNWLIEDRSTTPASALRPTPLPVRLGTIDRANAAINEITTAARWLIDTRGLTPTPRPVPPIGPLCATRYRRLGPCHRSCHLIADGPRALAAYRAIHPVAHACRILAEHMAWMRWQPEAEDMLPPLEQAARDLVRLVDAPPARRYAGKCLANLGPDSAGATRWCYEELYAAGRRDAITCPGCGHTHSAAARRGFLLGKAADQLLPAAEMARALSGLGTPVTAAMVRGHALRGRLAAHPPAHRGDDPLYRLGDVVDLLAEAERRRADHEAKREERAKSTRVARRRAELAQLLAGAERGNTRVAT